MHAVPTLHLLLKEAVKVVYLLTFLSDQRSSAQAGHIVMRSTRWA